MNCYWWRMIRYNYVCVCQAERLYISFLLAFRNIYSTFTADSFLHRAFHHPRCVGGPREATLLSVSVGLLNGGSYCISMSSRRAFLSSFPQKFGIFRGPSSRVSRWAAPVEINWSSCTRASDAASRGFPHSVIIKRRVSFPSQGTMVTFVTRGVFAALHFCGNAFIKI